MAEKTENLTELFFSRLRTDPNPSVVIAQFYSAMTGKTVGKSESQQFAKLIKWFGKLSVFSAVIDVARADDLEEFPFGLLFHICKRRLETVMGADMGMVSMESMENRLRNIEKAIERTKKIDPEKARKYLEGG